VDHDHSQATAKPLKQHNTTVYFTTVWCSTVTEYRHAKKNNADALRAERGPCLSVNVTPGALHRAMGILNAILVALDTRGYTTKIEMDGGYPHTVIAVGTERVSMSIEEVIECVERNRL